MDPEFEVWYEWTQRLRSYFIEQLRLLDLRVGNPNVRSWFDIEHSDNFETNFTHSRNIIMNLRTRFINRQRIVDEAKVFYIMGSRRIREWENRATNYPDNLNRIEPFTIEETTQLVGLLRSLFRFNDRLVEMGTRDYEAAVQVLGPDNEDLKLFYCQWDLRILEPNGLYSLGYYPGYREDDPYYEALRPRRRDPSPEPLRARRQRRELQVQIPQNPQIPLPPIPPPPLPHARDSRSSRLPFVETNASYGPFFREGVDCSLCADTHDPYEENGEQICTLPCGHMFCVGEMNRYARQMHRENLDVMCPNCRSHYLIFRDSGD
jgi:hypothetical protein